MIYVYEHLEFFLMRKASGILLRSVRTNIFLLRRTCYYQLAFPFWFRSILFMWTLILWSIIKIPPAQCLQRVGWSSTPMHYNVFVWSVWSIHSKHLLPSCLIFWHDTLNFFALGDLTALIFSFAARSWICLMAHLKELFSTLPRG